MSRDSIVTRAFSDHFHEGLEYYVTPFQRWTTLHVFTDFFIDQIIFEDFDRASRTKYIPRTACRNTYCRATPAWLLAADLMQSYGFDVSEVMSELGKWVEAGAPCCPTTYEQQSGPNFDVWDSIDSSEYSELLQQLTEEVFFVLFANRTFLHKFNAHLVSWVRNSEPDEWLENNNLFRKSGRDGATLKRVSIPAWAKRAVFFRDRGRCCVCERDLGGTYSPVNRAQYDHIVPLAGGGLNDVSNLQLLCENCNNKKRANRHEPSRIYERWFPIGNQYKTRRVPTLADIVQTL